MTALPRPVAAVGITAFEIERRASGTYAVARGEGWEVAVPLAPATVGPCTRCRILMVRYGPGGSPLCPACRDGDVP